MELKFNIKPMVMTARTKLEVLRKINDFVSSHSVTTYSLHANNVLLDKRTNKVYVYNLQKKRGKYPYHGFDPKTGKLLVGAKRIKRTYNTWTAYVYVIPYEILKILNVKVSQGLRNFEIQKRK